MIPIKKGAVLPEGCVLVYLLFAFIVLKVHFYFLFEAPKCLDFSNNSWESFFCMFSYEPSDLETLKIPCFKQPNAGIW